MSALTEHYSLANGTSIPKLGFGTWQIPEGAVAYDAVAAAIAAGYRHIDTARVYGNEVSVGRAIADSGVPRAEIYLTTKVLAEAKSYESAADSIAASLEALGVDYIDLLLIHAPWPWTDMGGDYAEGNAEAWRAMEDALAAGQVRSIGVSNFDVGQLEALISVSRHKPLVNQVKYYVGHTQGDIPAYCEANGILVEGFSPLATGSALDNEGLATIAAKYDRTVAQLCIRYSLQKGVLPLPKTTTPSRMAENADVDFEIGADDMATLDGMPDTASVQYQPGVPRTT